MDAQQIALVQETFEQVAPIADTAAELFYGRLFTLDPGLRPLFKGDMNEQKVKLMQTLAMVARGLHQFETIRPAVEKLGRRHVAYGVEDAHYQTVGQALLWTLEQGLGDSYTPEVAAAWTAAYTILAETMQRAAAEVA